MSQEEVIKAKSYWEDTLKGEFRIYLTRGDGLIYAPVYAYVFFKDCTQYIFARMFNASQKPSEILEALSHEIFAESELISSCPSMDEFVRRKRYLEQYYSKYVPTWYCTDRDQDRYVFDPIRQAYASPEYEDFVKHHIWLYSQLVKTIKPTIFPMTNQWLEGDRMEMYLSLLPYASEDDPNLADVKAYINKNAGKCAKKYYEQGYSKLALELVQNGYVKKPTLKKLLEMANDKDDAQFAAILVDILGESTKKESKFAL